MDADSLVGQVISHYRIEEKLGEGGMGVVYRASDTTLRRPVAIKFLPPMGERMSEKRERFLHEARAASALNHPNIVTVHEIGQHGEMDYIVMEFIPGKTLHELIHHRGLSLSETLRYAVQIADAMTVAHAAGIIHRDLKPANILINERGQAKVVDFGLAKRAEDSYDADLTRTMQPQTLDGFAVGTLPYMSPEQAEGKRVDARSDIFSFGAILYEMVTGRRAFQGQTAASTLIAIVTKEPPAASSAGNIPNELDRLIGRCLRKDPEQRLQHAGDLRIELEELRQTWESSRTIPVISTPPPSVTGSANIAVGSPASVAPTAAMPPGAAAPPIRKWGRRWAAGGVLLAAAAAAGWYYYAGRPRGFPQPTAFKRLTSDAGLTAWPAMSRDGKFVAYASDRGEDANLHIWVQQIGGGEPIRLTHSQADDFEPSFSPDGTKIVFHSARDGGGVYVVGTLGGDARLVARNGRRPRFSPDGTHILYWAGGDFGQIFLIDVNGGAPQPVAPKFHSARYPVWSTDGQFILFEGYNQPTSGAPKDEDWWVAPVGGGAPVKTDIMPALDARHLKMPSGFGALVPWAWLSNNEILFSCRAADSINVWKAPISGRTKKISGPPQQVTFGTSMELYPDAVLDGEGGARVVFASLAQKIDLWSLPVDANRGTVRGELERVTKGGNEATQVSISADGSRIAFLWDRDGKSKVWIRNLRTGKETGVTTPTEQWVPSISPDGASVAWTSFEQQRLQRVYRVSLDPDGQPGLPEMLCDRCGSLSSWSLDGRLALYGHEGRVGVLDLRTHEKHDVLDRPPNQDVWGGRFSPDARWIIFNVTSQVHSQVYLAPFDAQASGPVPREKWIAATGGETWDDKPRWSPDGKSIYFLSQRDGFRCIWRQALDPRTHLPAGDAAAIRHFHSARLSMMNVNIGPLSIAVAPDKLVFSLGELTGNVWTATAERR